MTNPLIFRIFQIKDIVVMEIARLSNINRALKMTNLLILDYFRLKILL